MAESKKSYELVVNEYHETTGTDPFTYKTHHKGDKVSLTAEQAERLIAAGAVKADSGDDAEEPGGQPTAPEGKAPGAGDGSEEAGTVGDGGPDPQGSGSTVASTDADAGAGATEPAKTAGSGKARK